MWIKSRFATWEAEGQVEERIQRALGEGERWRLARIARGVDTGRHHGRLLAPASRRLHWLAERAAGWLAGRTTMVWPNGQADAATSKSGPTRQGSLVKHEPKARSQIQKEWMDAS